MARERARARAKAGSGDGGHGAARRRPQGSEFPYPALVSLPTHATFAQTISQEKLANLDDMIVCSGTEGDFGDCWTEVCATSIGSGKNLLELPPTTSDLAKCCYQIVSCHSQILDMV